MKKITSPEEFYGFLPGTDREMVRWDKIVAYFYQLQKETDKMTVTDMGKTTLGNPFLELVISSPENLADIERYKKISKTLADPRGLSQEEISKLVSAGKAVCVQSYSMHATEIGGTQMISQLVYDLLSKDTDDVKRILDNVIFVCVPCLNPDGNIMVADWYYETKGTEYEGSRLPKLYHYYSGHDNSHDGLASKLIESQYMNKILFQEWLPQSYMDVHQYRGLCSRMYLPPLKEPMMAGTDPITVREKWFYGSSMALLLESKGFKGITNSSRWRDYGTGGLHSIADLHNITTLLSESASVKVATPRFEDPTQLTGDDETNSPGTGPLLKRPNPWPGGWWHLSDIVHQMYWCCFGLLKTMADNREWILSNMALKAINQTNRGKESETKAYIFPADQHDRGNLLRVINILRELNIEVFRAEKGFRAGEKVFDAGSYVVFSEQPYFGFVKMALQRNNLEENIWTRNRAGVMEAAVDRCLPDWFGVSCIPVSEKPFGDFILVDTIDFQVPEVLPAEGFYLQGSENASYKTVNLLLKENIKVVRNLDAENKDFYVECAAGTLNRILKDAPANVVIAAERPQNVKQVKKARVGVYQRFIGGNNCEGWMRLALDNSSFEYRSVFAEDVLNDALDDLDIFVIPSDNMALLLGEKAIVGDSLYALTMIRLGKLPPEYLKGLGTAGVEKIRAFCERGGRLLCTNHASSFATDYLDISVYNVTKGKKTTEYNSNYSTVNVKFNTDDPVCYGMPASGIAVHGNGPAFKLGDRHGGFHTEFSRLPATFEKLDRLLCSGFIDGGKLIEKKGAIAVSKVGKGEVVLYGFEPTQFCASEGTFKLLFNMLYI